MDSVCVLTWVASLCLVVDVIDSAEGLNITATIGQDVTLPCHAEDYMPFEVVEWSRPENNSRYVLVFNIQNPELKIPKSYEGRVELKDMKNGDVSLVLKNVIAEDRGIYECYVMKETKRRKRGMLLPRPVSTIYLDVAPPPPPGSGHIGLILVLLVSALMVAALMVAALMVAALMVAALRVAALRVAALRVAALMVAALAAVFVRNKKKNDEEAVETLQM